MSLLPYNEVREHKIIIWEGQPYEVITSHVFRKQQRKPVNATKIKNLITGRVAEISFASSDKIEEADISTRKALYLYIAKGEVWFCDTKDKANRFAIKEEVVGDKIKFVKSNTEVELSIFTDKEDEELIIGVKLPIKVELRIKDVAPSIKGASVTGGNKVATLETGATIQVPMFIENDELVRINTETGEYVERVN